MRNFIALALLSICFVHAQQNLNINEGMTKYTGSQVDGASGAIDMAGVEGSVFFHDSYKSGLIQKSVSVETTNELSLRYNGYSGFFESEGGRNLNAKNGMRVTLGGDEVWYYLEGKWLMSLDPNIKVYLRPKVIFRPGIEAKTAMGDSYPSKFKRQDEYYFDEGDSKPLKKISKRKSKKLLK